MSNLLKDASILLTPTAYENGRMNAIKPYKDLYGPELVLNPNFEDSSWWGLDVSWSISNGSANCNGTGTIYKGGVVTIGKTYKVQVEISSYTSGTLSYPNASNYSIPSAIGVYTFYYVANSQTVSFTGSSFIGSIDNVSVVEDLSGDFQFSRNSAATRVNAQGLVENVQIISSELVSNGNFSQIGTEEVSNGNFSQEGSELGDTGTISNNNGGVITQILNTSYNATSDGSSTSTTRPRLNNFNVTNGKSYKLTITPSNQSGNIKFTVNNDGANLVVYNDLSSPLELYFVNGSNFRMFFDGTNTFNVDFEVSLKEVGQDWTISSGASVGEDKLDIDAGAFDFFATQTALTNGLNYKVTLDAEVTSGDILLYTGTQFALINSSGSYTFYTTSDSAQIRFRSGGSGFNGSITNISVKEVGQDWTFGTGWSVDQTNSKATCDGTQTSTSTLQTAQGISNIQNDLVKLSFEIKDYSAGAVSVTLQGTGGIEFNNLAANGVYEINITSTDSLPRLLFNANSSFVGSVTNISVKEITDDTDLPRINYEGFSYQDSLGSEEIVNGDFSNGSANWGNYTSGSSTIVFTDVATLNVDASNSNVGIYQENVFASGKQYKVVLRIKASSSFDAEVLETQGAATVSTIGSVSLTTSYQDFTFYFTGTGTNDIFIHRKFSSPSANQSITIDNVSVKEYLGQEVVPDSGCGSWLLEPQSTNLSTKSENISGWSFPTNVTTTQNYGTSPDGSVNSTRLQFTSNGFMNDALTLTSGTEYTLSIYAKRNDTGTQSFGFYVDGIPTVVGGITLTEEWQRFTYTYTASSSSSIGLAGDSGADVSVFGFQAEQQSYATSYIPTNGATNTRLQDIATNSGNSTLINSTEGVLYAEIDALANYNLQRWFSLSDGTTSNTVKIGFANSTTDYRFACEVRSGAVLSAFMTYNFGAVEPTFTKVAFKYKENDFALWVNGTEVSTDTSGSAPIGLSELAFDRGGGAQKFEGKTKAVAVFKEALTDANLRCLTYPNPVATTFDLDFDTIAEQFTFTRGSEATFVNEQGLIESTNQIGPELVTNGDFENGSTGWSLSGSNISIANGKGISTGSNFGAQFKQTILQTNKTYKLTFDIVDYTSGAIGLTANYYGNQNVFSSIGTHTAVFTSLNQTELRIYSENFIGSIDNVSVKEVTTATNTPRIDYSTGEKAFLLEPQSTNLITYSSDLSSLNLRSNAVVTSNEVISPSGDLDADKITFDGTFPGRVEQTIAATVGQPYTISVYLKNKDLSDVSQVWIGFSAAAQGQFVTITDEWQRYDITANADGTNEYPRIQFSGTGSLYAWGFQVEQQSYATSYIPTDGASATRNQELCVDATPVINSEEGTLYFDAAYLNDTGSYRKISINDGTNSNQVTIEDRPVSNQVKAFVAVGGGSSMSITTTLTDVKKFNKMALKWKQNNFSFWVNGTKVYEDLSGASFSSGVLNKLSFGVGNSSNFIGNTKGLKVYPKALADVQLEDLTTI